MGILPYAIFPFVGADLLIDPYQAQISNLGSQVLEDITNCEGTTRHGIIRCTVPRAVCLLRS
jgi:hypothetical protein